MRTVILALALAACAPTDYQPTELRDAGGTCSQTLVAHGVCPTHICGHPSSWSVSACIDDGDSELAAELAAAGAEVPHGGVVSWCLVDAAGSSTCGVETENSAHPWCSFDPEDPGICDITCCILTILNGGCGGCLDPGGEDDGGEGE